MKKKVKNLTLGVLAVFFLAVSFVLVDFTYAFEAKTAEVSTRSVKYLAHNSATAEATANPNGFNTHVWFQWGYDPNNLTNKTTSQSIGSGNKNVTVLADLNPLVPDRLYYYRAVAGNYEHTIYGSTLSFRTAKVDSFSSGSMILATVYTRVAINITQVSATIGADVNPKDSNTQVWFQWGFSSSGLVNFTPVQSAGSGKSSVIVLSGLDSLVPDTVYFYRAVAKNDAGTSYGSTLSFKTRSVSQSSQSFGFLPTSSGKTTITSKPVMAVNISADKTRVSRQEVFVYKVRYKNIGVSDADNVVLELVLPEEVKLQTAAPFCYFFEKENLVFQLGRVKKSEEGFVDVQVGTSASVKDGKDLTAVVNLRFVEIGSGSQNKVSDSLTVVVGSGPEDSEIPVTAGVGFLSVGGTTLWLLLITFLVVFLVFYVYYTHRKLHKILKG